jgi:endonuclease-3
MSKSKTEMLVELQARVAKITAKFRKQHPDARTALDFSTPLEMLVATILSAQTTDAGVNRLTPALFKKYKTAADYASAEPAELEAMIRASGFFRQKAKSLMGVGKMLVQKFGGRVPETMAELMQLPGVARKTANVVMGSAFGQAEGIAVDRHVARVAGRLGLTKNADPIKIEQDLMAAVPQKNWIEFSHLLILHGRQICKAPKPKCDVCPVNDLCPSAFKL